MFQFYIHFSSPTLTDWIQAITGLIGLYLLYRTLKLQGEATKAQAEAIALQAKATDDQLSMTQLEHNRFLLEIRPQFEGIIIPAEYKEFGENRTFHFQLKLNQNRAKDCFVLPHTDHLNGNFGVISYEYMDAHQKIDLICMKISESDRWLALYFEVFFRDEVDTCYKQIVSGRFSSLIVSTVIKIKPKEFLEAWNKLAH